MMSFLPHSSSSSSASSPGPCPQPLSRAAQLEAYLQSCQSSSAPACSSSKSSPAGGSVSDLCARCSLEVGCGEAPCSWWRASLRFLGLTCAAFLGALLTCGLSVGWSLYDSRRVGFIMHNVGIRTPNSSYSALHQLEFLICVTILGIFLSGIVDALPPRWLFATVFIVALPVCFGYATRLSLCNILIRSHHSSSLVRVYVDILKKLQLVWTGQKLLHPLPPMSRLENMLLIKYGDLDCSLAMKSLRKSLASALVDLENSLLTQGSTADVDSDFLSACRKNANYGEGSTIVASSASIVAKSDNLFQVLLPEILRSLMSVWSSPLVSMQYKSDYGLRSESSSRQGRGFSFHHFIFIQMFRTGPRVVMYEVFVPMVCSGLKLFTLYCCLRDFQSSLVSFLPSDFMDLEVGVQRKSAVEELFSYHSTNNDTSREQFTSPLADTVLIYGELRRRLSQSRATLEELSVQLWQCEVELAAAASFIVVPLNGGGVLFPSSTELTPASSPSYDNYESALIVKTRNSVVQAMHLLSGKRSLCRMSNGEEADSGDIDISVDQDMILQNIISGHRNQASDLTNLLELMGDLVRSLQISDSKEESRELSSTTSTMLKEQITGYEQDTRNEREKIDQVYDCASVYTTHTGPETDSTYSNHVVPGGDTLEGVVEVITGHVLDANEIQKIKEGFHKESQLSREREAESRLQRAQVMMELNGQISILKDIEQLRERERTVPIGLLKEGACSGDPSLRQETWIGLEEAEQNIRSNSHERTSNSESIEEVAGGERCQQIWEGLFQAEIAGVLQQRHPRSKSQNDFID